MEWFQLGTMSWMGFASAGWLWIGRNTAALIAGSMLPTATGVWVVLDQYGIPVLPQLPEIPGLPIAAEPLMTPWWHKIAA